MIITYFETHQIKPAPEDSILGETGAGWEEGMIFYAFRYANSQSVNQIYLWRDNTNEKPMQGTN